MPRSGGESDKLGNRYEGIWTVGRLLELAAAETAAVTVEPFGEDSLGVEFVVRRHDGGHDYHCAKRQRSKGEWSLAELARTNAITGRSILSDLLAKLAISGKNGCWFISSTGANDFRELTERARRRAAFADFEADLKGEASDALQRAFDRHLQPLATDWESAYSYLRRMEVTLIDEATLRRQVDQHISFLVYRPDGREFAPAEVRVILADFILDQLGTEIRQDSVWKYLAKLGYAKRDWANDPTIRGTVRRQNQGYVRAVEFDLINGTRIQRTEVTAITQAVTGNTGVKTVLVSAVAGAGKSCVITQCIEMLDSRNVPVLVVRLDRHGDAHSTQELGNQMELPRSPAVVLAAIANGQESVLVVDQLDAVSQVSGRYPHLWQVFEELCQEASSYPNMRVAVVCRDFDLENDSRLRKLKHPPLVSHVKVDLLSIADVDSALAAGGCAGAALTAAQKEILRTPLHLMLLLESLGEKDSQIGFVNIGELFDRYWQRKQRAVVDRLGNASAWVPVIDRACEQMSRGLALYAPYIAFDEYPETTAAMLTEHVFVRDGNKLRFFHESFFDYAYARRFCADGQNLIALLLSGEQYLFRRSQVRQILAFMRDHMRDAYLLQFRELLVHPKVRFHIKRLVLAWLGTLPAPTAEEWDIVDGLLSDTDIMRSALPPIRNSLSWCHLLLQLGVIKKWLASPDEALVNRGMWFLLFDDFQKERSEAAAELLAPYRGQSPEWTRRLRAYFRCGNAHCSRPMQELFLGLVDDGAFDQNAPEDAGSMWHDLHTAGKSEPSFVLEVIVHWLDRRIAVAEDSLDEDALDLSDRDQAGVRLIVEVAAAAPSEFVAMILPRVVQIVRATQKSVRFGLLRDEVWWYLSNTVSTGIATALLNELVKALETLATLSPEIVEVEFTDLVQTEFRTIAFLLLRTWSANPAYFGSHCLTFLTGDSRRLDVGYSYYGGGGNGEAAITRGAIEACVPHVSPQDREELEHAILEFSSPGYEGEYKGWTQRLLLESFGEKYLSQNGQRILDDLRARYPGQDTELPPTIDSELMTFVGSPISLEATCTFTDDDWLNAMREFDYGWDSPRPAGELKGTAVELSRILQPQVRLDRHRFAMLAIRMEDSIRPEYFEAILDGICGVENMSPEEREKDNAEFEHLNTEVVLNVLRRLHRLPTRPCGRSICRAFEKMAKRSIDESDLQIITHYAVDDPDPQVDDWINQDHEGKQDAARDAHFRGYNSVRGHAARVIKTLLFADYSRLAIFQSPIQELVHDRSLSVRTCAVEALLPMLNHDRDEAVRLFLEACDDADLVVGSNPFESFINYAIGTHYSTLRELLMRLVHSTSSSTVKSAARQICLASLTNEDAKTDAEGVRHGTEAMRHGAAQVYSRNLGHCVVGEECCKHLPGFFADPSSDVRSTAGDCFLHLDDGDLNEFIDLIRAYIESRAFPSSHDDLLRLLDKSTWQLPNITIRLAERFVSEFGAAAGDLSTAAAGDAPTVSKLVIRLCSQTSDTMVKSRCLDLIDEMERLGFYGIESQLAEHDR